MRAFVIALVLAGSGPVCAAPDRTLQGAQLAATCAACHRLDGRANGIPSIVGLGPERVIAMMQAFKTDADANHLMHAVSLTLSDAEIAAVAGYLATLGTEAKAP